MKFDLTNYVAVLAVLPTQDYSASANGTSQDLGPYWGRVLFRIDAGNSSAGTNPNLLFTIKESTDNGNWTNSAVTTVNINAASAQIISYDTRGHGRYVRFDGVISGTNSPSFPVGIVGVTEKLYNPA